MTRADRSKRELADDDRSMIMPPRMEPPYQPHRRQPSIDDFQKLHPQAPHYYSQSNGQSPPAHAVPTQRGLPPTTPQPPGKPRFGLLARIGMIIGAVFLIIIFGRLTSSGSDSPSSTSTTGSQTTYEDPAPAAVVPPVAPVAPVSPVAPAPAKTITARGWAKIAKSPDAHAGESIIVYGKVTQFDAATGTDSFRAAVDGIKHPVEYGYAAYETNTVLTSATADLSDLVEGDLFKAEVVVSGSISYDTTLGGTTTVPKLNVTRIMTIGTEK